MAGVRQDGFTPRIGPVKAVVVDVGRANGLAGKLGRVPADAEVKLEPWLVDAGRVVRGVLR